MEPEGSLPHSQIPATCPYPEPARSSPYPHILLPGDPSQYYPPIYSSVSQVVSFLQVSPPKPCIRLSSPHIRATCPAHLILLDFITHTILGCMYIMFVVLMIQISNSCGSRSMYDVTGSPSKAACHLRATS